MRGISAMYDAVANLAHENKHFFSSRTDFDGTHLQLGRSESGFLGFSSCDRWCSSPLSFFHVGVF